MDKPKKPAVDDFFWMYLDERFTAQDQQRDALKELVKQEFGQMRDAIEIATKELERRLSELNHAHARAVEVQHTYVPREMYDQRHREVEGKVAKNESTLQTVIGRVAGLTAVVAILTTLLIGLLTYLIYNHGKM